MKTVLLGNILKLEYGKPLPRDRRRVDGKYPVYGANGIKEMANDYYYEDQSIIVGRKGSAGELTLTDGKFWPLDVTYFVTHDDSKTDILYVYRLLQSLNLRKLAKGVKPGINRNEVYSMVVNLPSLTMQRHIASRLSETFDEVDKVKTINEKNLLNIQELFRSSLENTFLTAKKFG